MSYVVSVKSMEKISQNFVAFSEYMNFTKTWEQGYIPLGPSIETLWKFIPLLVIADEKYKWILWVAHKILLNLDFK